MALDFTTLFSDILYNVGDFFGLLTSLSVVKPYDLLDWIRAGMTYQGYEFPLPYTNVYTGITWSFSIGYSFWEIPLIGQIVGTIIGFIGLVLFNGWLGAPLFIALPCGFATMGVVFALVSYIAKIVKNVNPTS